MNAQMLDEILLPLADEFEAGDRGFRTFAPSSVAEYEPLRECLVKLIDEGSLLDYRTRAYQFSPAGYSKYKSRIDALRLMPR